MTALAAKHNKLAVGALALLVAFPLAAKHWDQLFYVSFATRILIYALAASSLNLILGYGGHLWTQGFDYGEIERRLKTAMNGEGDWRKTLQGLGARYLFWGREEKLNYPASLKPWESQGPPLMNGDWGAIYDLGELPTAAGQR